MTVYLSRIVVNSVRNSTIKSFSVPEFVLPQFRFYSNKKGILSLPRVLSARKISSDAIIPTLALENSTIPLKKKIIHKKAIVDDLAKKEGHYLTLAYVTANSYDLKALKEALVQQKLYEPATLQAQEIGDVVVAKAVYSVGAEPREIIFFREGAVVFWNCTELEASNVLDLVRKFEVDSYPRDVVEKEREVMTYSYEPKAKKCYLQEAFVLVPERDNSLEKFTFSHAMTQSARLGAWETRLEELAAAIRQHSAVMERHGVTNVDKKAVVRKLGELFSLRHQLNVESDLLDTPDMYWEQEQLERLYSSTVAYFTIQRRTRVLNERLAHCVELLELLDGWAQDRHHIRLEWMIIVLILIEVCFEMLHLFERHVSFEWRGVRPPAPLAQWLLPKLPAPPALVAPTVYEDKILRDIFILDT